LKLKNSLRRLIIPVTMMAAFVGAPLPASATVDVICNSGRFVVTSGANTLELPYCANKSLSTVNTAVTRAVIVINGTGRNADEYAQYVYDAAATSGVTASTLVIAPQFLADEDLDAHVLANEDRVLFWDEGGWKDGALSLSTSSRPKPFQVSSFAVLDQLMANLATSGSFPNLAKVVVAGHSAGGQVVNRYAAGTAAPQNHAGISFRFVVANPSSYLYLDARRPAPNSMTTFRTLTSREINKCSGYNTYKYGLTGLNEYMSAVGASTLASRYQSRNVIYLLGTADTTNSNSLDVSCQGNWQGPHRLWRGTAFHNFLSLYYGGTSVYTNHIKALVEGIGHDGAAMFNSSVGRGYLFP
jgi:hypothetical protein